MGLSTRPVVKKRELTVFDLPVCEAPSFPRERRTSSVYQNSRIKQLHQFSSEKENDNKPKTKTKPTTPIAHLRLREMSETKLLQLHSPRAQRQFTDMHILTYAGSRSKSDNSWFQRNENAKTINKPNTLNSNDLHNFNPTILPPITSKGEPILRRPTMELSRPIAESDPAFQLITKGKELKPFSFQGDLRKSRDFYSQHYPLLMRKILETPANQIRTKSALVTQESAKEFSKRDTSANRRRLQLHNRVKELESMLSELEIDDDITTELRNPVFYPVTWNT